MKATIDLDVLKKYLLSHPMAKIYLASEMGYRSTHVIDKWIERGNIPRMRKEQVIRTIKHLSKRD